MDTLQTRPKDGLVRVGSRDQSLVGWKFTVVEAHLLNHRAHGTWCSVTCLAQTVYHRASQKNQKNVRDRLRSIVRKMINAHRFLVVEYAMRGSGSHGEAQRFKIYDGATEDERQAALQQLEQMRRRREISESYYEEARRLLCEPVQPQPHAC